MNCLSVNHGEKNKIKKSSENIGRYRYTVCRSITSSYPQPLGQDSNPLTTRLSFPTHVILINAPHSTLHKNNMKCMFDCVSAVARNSEQSIFEYYVCAAGLGWIQMERQILANVKLTLSKAKVRTVYSASVSVFSRVILMSPYISLSSGQYLQHLT